MRSLLLCLALLVAAPAAAQVAPEQTGRIETLPVPPRPHWVWSADPVLQRTALLDLDEGRFLGIVNGGYGLPMPLFPRTRPELYVPATYYSRGTHGTRTDVVEFYDTATLTLQGEVEVPPKRATNAFTIGHSALTDDDRFAALFNWTTGTSLSIVDVAARRFAGEIALPGCSLVFAAGPRRLFSLCADGALFTLQLNDDGSEAARATSKPFFDPKADPLIEKGARLGAQWLFASFEGHLYAVDASGAAPVFGEPWSLFSDADRAASWRVGGNQPLAAHRASGRLFVLVHQGGPDTHKEPGEEVWVYDVAARRRVARIPLLTPGVTILGFPIGPGAGWPAPVATVAQWAIDTFTPAMVGFIEVTQDEQPLLVTASQFSGSLGVYDARSGEFVRRVGPTGWTSDVLQAPWGGP
jgi:methylamine dehydrogenase heavy chain